jgi:hypothetical protein
MFTRRRHLSLCWVLPSHIYDLLSCYSPSYACVFMVPISVRFSSHNTACICPFPCACHMLCPYHPSWFAHRNSTCWEVQILQTLVFRYTSYKGFRTFLCFAYARRCLSIDCSFLQCDNCLVERNVCPPSSLWLWHVFLYSEILYATWLAFMNPCMWYNYENNQQYALYRLIYCSKSALHVSGDLFAHHQEHLTVFPVSDSLHQSCCRQQLGWTLPDTVNTVKCSWWWVKTSPETCRADKK